MNYRTLAVLLLLVLLSFPALRALFIPDFYTSHDGLTHTARIANFYLALREGQIPPRLAPNLFGSLGFPIFIFIYPLPYLLGSAFHALGASFTDSFELVIGLGFVLSAITMFIFTKRLFGIWPAVAASVFYSWAPYRFSQIYVRGAIAESFAYLFIPLVLLSLHKLSGSPSRQWLALGSFSLAGLLLSHQLVTLMFLPVFLLFGLLFLKESQKKRPFAVSAVIMGVLGFAMSAYIYLPALVERSYLHFDELIDYYADHFVTIPQLIHSPWSYGFSMPGSLMDDMSFQVGLTHLLAVGLAVLTLSILIWKRRREAAKVPGVWVAAVSFVLFAFSIVLMLDHPLIRLLWKYVPPISVIDFPWRLLGVSVFAASILAAFLFRMTTNKLLLLPLVFFIFYANRNHLRINQTQVLDDAFFLSYLETATWRNEFLPIWRQTNKYQHIERNFTVMEGNPKVGIIEAKTHRLSLNVEAEERGRLNINRLYVPGWTVKMDGKTLKLGEGFEVSRDVALETETSPYVDRSGLLSVKVPSGSHTIEAEFSETPVRAAGMALSAIGSVSAVGLLLRKKQ